MDDSIFCPECGTRQNLSRASFEPQQQQSLSGGEAVVRGTGVVPPQAFAANQQNTPQASGDFHESSIASLPNDLVSQIAASVQPEQLQQQAPPQQTPIQSMPADGPSLSQIPSGPVASGPTIVPMTTDLGSAPVTSPADDLVERIHVAEKEIKEEQRSKWLEMNETAS